MKWKALLGNGEIGFHTVNTDINHRVCEKVDTEAHAYLIAATPELLEACKYTIEKMRGIKGKTFPIGPIINVIDKAEGGK